MNATEALAGSDTAESINDSIDALRQAFRLAIEHLIYAMFMLSSFRPSFSRQEPFNAEENC